MTDLRADGLTEIDLLYSIALRLERIAVALEGRATVGHSPAPLAPQQLPATYPIEWVCPIHGQVKTVPAGFSQRTQKAYGEFKACPVAGCDQKPPRPATTAHSGPQQMP